MGTSPNSSKHSKVWLVIAFIAGCGICLFIGGIPLISYSSIHPTQPSIPQTQYPTSISINATTTSQALLPDFPWPPPKPSAIASLTLGTVGNLAGNGTTFSDVDNRITTALAAGGYDEKSYFGVPNGFAIVTHLEQITSDSYPENSNRWVSELAPVSITEFSINKYLEALFSIPQGRYRIFVFIITSHLVVSSGTPISQGAAQDWVIQGANKLPNWMETLPYTKDYTCTVYVYEFTQSGVGANANQNIPSDITGRQHLERAGLWDILEK